jgi:hypothetical protein
MGREGRPLCSYDPRYIPSDCTVHGVRITNVDTTDQKEAIKRLEEQTRQCIQAWLYVV